MKDVSKQYIENIKSLGRKQFVMLNKITSGGYITDEQINSVAINREASLLKSIMTEVVLDITVKLNINEEISITHGIFLQERGLYESKNYGNYIVYSVTKKEDTNSYEIKCYDKMLYSMKDYEAVPVSYPCTLKHYIEKLCEKLGYTLGTNHFANDSQMLESDVFEDLTYKYRDALDDIAEATASTIYVDNNNLILGQPKETDAIIDEEMLKNVNVNFEKQYGYINSVVLSRSAESDNVYLKDNESILQYGLTEFKIKDNQIMNDNRRSRFLPEIANKLFDIRFYLNDFSSTGIMYLDLLDYYTVKIGSNSYKCLMLSDERIITQGIEENVFTGMPENSETDYTKADKTDMRINQTYLIVDKQNQKIESVVTNVNEQNNKISQIQQTVDEINSKITDILDLTVSGDSMAGVVYLDKINESEPVNITVFPTEKSIMHIYPTINASKKFYPSENLYSTKIQIEFYNTKTEEKFYLDIPDDLLYFSEDIYDIFLFDYDSQSMKIVKKCEFNQYGIIMPKRYEEVVEYEFPHIRITNGDYKISIINTNTGYLQVRLMAQNIYTTQFVTKAELNSEISQAAESINLSVNRKLEGYSTTEEVNSSINLKANEINLGVNQKLTDYSTTTQMNSAINIKADEINSTVSTKVGNNEIISKINQTAESIKILANKLGLSANDVLNIIAGNSINLTSKNITINSDNFNIDKYGSVSIKDAGDGINGNLKITSNDGSLLGLYASWGLNFETNSLVAILNYRQLSFLQNAMGSDYGADIGLNYNDLTPYVSLYYYGTRTDITHQGIRTPSVTQTSLATEKKNFEKFENALDKLKDIDIYKYNLNFENDTNKKHIGFVIGENYKYLSELTNNDNNAVDLYSLASFTLQVCKEQQAEIEKLKNEINKLKEA